jgi:class 3 adenylate cyclase
MLRAKNKKGTPTKGEGSLREGARGERPELSFKKTPTKNQDDATQNAAVLASYVPADVVLRLAVQEAPLPPSDPEEEQFDCAVAFVDISGFTALSERLAKQSGKQGSELLSVYVNAYLQRLIQGVSLFYGDVIKFAGDALQVPLPLNATEHEGCCTPFIT